MPKYNFLCGLVACVLSLTTSCSDNTTMTTTIQTSMGTIEVELFTEQAPITVKNFQRYIDEQFFDGTTFHRVIPGFVIQGGGLLPNMQQKQIPFPSIKNESYNGLKNTAGTLSMARTPAPDSATSQFFINLKENSFLDKTPTNPGYAVFGKVIAGMDVVHEIAKVETTNVGGHQNVPREPILIESIR